MSQIYFFKKNKKNNNNNNNEKTMIYPKVARKQIIAGSGKQLIKYKIVSYIYKYRHHTPVLALS